MEMIRIFFMLNIFMFYALVTNSGAVVCTVDDDNDDDNNNNHVMDKKHFESKITFENPNDLNKYAQLFFHFTQKVRINHGKKEVPLLVHCGTGISRTASFIALDIAIDQYEAEGEVSVYDIVRRMRNERPLMVRSLDQYRLKPGKKLKRKHEQK